VKAQHKSAYFSVSQGTLREDYVTKKVMPEFPAGAGEAGLQGLVTVIVEFNPEGELTRVALNPQASQFAAPTRDQIVYEASSDWKPRGQFLKDKDLFEAVQAAVKQWKIRKLDKESDPLRLRSELTFNFILENGLGRVEDGPEGATHRGISEFPDDEKEKAVPSPW
jgi:hypothetical protein